MIYGELTMPVSERKITMTCIIPEKAARLFDEWISKEHKTTY
ncbi:MAG: hypothetical protein NVSMB7_10080 [Chitinophagaceae bacterium]